MNIDDYRFITETKQFAINLITGHISDNPKLLKRIKKEGHNSLEWRGALESNRKLVDRVLREVDMQIIQAARYHIYDIERVEDTAQEMRLMVVDIVLKNLERDFDNLLTFVRSCIKNFARRACSSMQRVKRRSVIDGAMSIDDLMAMFEIAELRISDFGEDSTAWENIPDTFDLSSQAFNFSLPSDNIYWNELLVLIEEFLTPRESEMFKLLIENFGISSKEIGEILGYTDLSGVSHVIMRIREKVTDILKRDLIL